MSQLVCDISNTAIEFSSDTTYILLIALERFCVQGKQSMRASFNLKIIAVSFLLKMSSYCVVVKDTGWQFLMFLSTVTSLGNRMPVISVIHSLRTNGKEWGMEVL